MTYDLIILGGGSAGMAAALVAGRASLNTLVINREAARNRVTRHTHGFLTRDGTPPNELLQIAKKQLLTYATVNYLVGGAVEVQRTSAGFTITDDNGNHHRAARLLIATGFVDDLAALNLPGIEAVYGRSVFPCPFCDGFELRDKHLAVFAHTQNPNGLRHFLSMMAVLSSSDVTVLTNGKPLDPDFHTELADRGIVVIHEPVIGLSHTDGQLTAVQFESRELACDGGFVAGNFARPATTFATELGVKSALNPWGWELLVADDLGKTDVSNLYLAGDVRAGFGGITAAVAQGAACAAAIVAELAVERWRG